MHHVDVPLQLLAMLGRVQTVRALVDADLLLVHILQVVQVVAWVLRVVAARGAGVVAFHLALGQLLVDQVGQLQPALITVYPLGG